MKQQNFTTYSAWPHPFFTHNFFLLTQAWSPMKRFKHALMDFGKIVLLLVTEYSSRALNRTHLLHCISKKTKCYSIHNACIIGVILTRKKKRNSYNYRQSVDTQACKVATTSTSWVEWIGSNETKEPLHLHHKAWELDLRLLLAYE